MANSRVSGSNYEYATVDTAPSGEGYFTNPISPRELRRMKGETEVFFSIRETNPSDSAPSVVNVVLQFKCPGDQGWQTYVSLDGSTFVTGNRIGLKDLGAGVLWRAGVISGEDTSGSVTFGFDW